MDLTNSMRYGPCNTWVYDRQVAACRGAEIQYFARDFTKSWRFRLSGTSFPFIISQLFLDTSTSLKTFVWSVDKLSYLTGITATELQPKINRYVMRNDISTRTETERSSYQLLFVIDWIGLIVMATFGETSDLFVVKCMVLKNRETGGRLNKKDGLTRYGDSHVKDKTS